MADKPFAIVNSVRTSHSVIAIAEVWTYDVWGNAKDGYEVNDRQCQTREAEFVCPVYVHGLPRMPGAKDDYRSFPAGGSFGVEQVSVTIAPEHKDIAAMLGFRVNQIDTEGDDLRIEVTRKRDRYPIGEIIITGWKDIMTGERIDAKY